MTSQIPFEPLTPEAMSRLTRDEQQVFIRAAQYVAEDRAAPIGTGVVADLVLIVQRLITAGTSAERDLIRDDLGQLLEVLGLGDYARPESPHEVFGSCLAEVRRLLAAPPEAAIRADERARIRSLLPYNVNCCDGFAAAVADLIGEHEDSGDLDEARGDFGAQARVRLRIAGIRVLAEEAFGRLHKQRARAEATEAKLAAVKAASRDHLGREGACCPHFAEDVLAIIGGEETRDLTSAEAKAIADAERIEAAAAVLERRYPATRPEQLDTTITELHSIARAWRRMAGEQARRTGSEETPDGD